MRELVRELVRRFTVGPLGTVLLFPPLPEIKARRKGFRRCMADVDGVDNSRAHSAPPVPPTREDTPTLAPLETRRAQGRQRAPSPESDIYGATPRGEGDADRPHCCDPGGWPRVRNRGSRGGDEVDGGDVDDEEVDDGDATMSGETVVNTSKELSPSTRPPAKTTVGAIATGDGKPRTPNKTRQRRSS